jgi:SPP1 family predicted phage head-tail adaptor
MAMNDLIVIQQPDLTVRGGLGQTEPTYSTHQEAWADIVTISGNKNYVSDMAIYTDTKEFTIHYEEGKNVDTTMRILYDSRYFYITSINHKDRLKTVLIATEKNDD